VKKATKRELIVVATMISRMIGTPVFSDRTEYSVTTVNRSELDQGQSGDSLEIAEVHRRNYSSSGVFTSWAMAGPNLVKSRTFHVSKVFAPAFRAQ